MNSDGNEYFDSGFECCSSDESLPDWERDLLESTSLTQRQKAARLDFERAQERVLQLRAQLREMEEYARTAHEISVSIDREVIGR